MIKGDWKNLKLLRKSNTAVILGSGASINDITTREWARITSCDSWAINNWVYHPTFVPTFYSIEIKWYGYDILKRRLREKRKAYAKVNFIFQKNKQIKMPDKSRRYMRDVVWPTANVYEFDVVSRDPKRQSQSVNANYAFDAHALTKSYQCSLTHLLELVVRTGYDRVVLYGIDLSNSFYFWSDGDVKYGEVHHLTNKAHEGKDPNLPHNTSMITNFIIDMSHQMKYNIQQMFVGSTASVLHPRISLVNWESF